MEQGGYCIDVENELVFKSIQREESAKIRAVKKRINAENMYAKITYEENITWAKIVDVKDITGNNYFVDVKLEKVDQETERRLNRSEIVEPPIHPVNLAMSRALAFIFPTIIILGLFLVGLLLNAVFYWIGKE